MDVEDTGLNGTKAKIPFFTCKWLVGFALLFVGSIMHVSALPFCSLVVLSTSTATSIIFNNCLAVFYLGENFNWRLDLPAYTLIIAGCLAIVFVTPQDETDYDPEKIRSMILSTDSAVFISVYLILAICTIAQYCWHKS